MSQVIMIGCDLHAHNLVLRYAVGRGPCERITYENTASGRRRMIAHLKRLAREHAAERIVFAYEASSQGHRLSDQLHEAGIECYVLSPSHLPKSYKQATHKTDPNDAQTVLEILRGHVLAGNRLPVVWTPPLQLRDDRELVRARIDVADELKRVKVRIQDVFKPREIPLTSPTKSLWTKASVRSLREELIPKLGLALGTKVKLLLDRLEMYQREKNELDRALRRLSQEPRYREPCRQLRKLPGVGLLVAMSFLTEMGDLTRFRNRRQVGAYLGLCPTSHESGQKNDRKGRITRQGPSRLRKVLCQAAWVSVQRCTQAAATYHRLRHNQKQRNKKALVALMRKLGITMWRQALACGVSPELVGRGGPHWPGHSEGTGRGAPPPSTGHPLSPAVGEG